MFARSLRSSFGFGLVALATVLRAAITFQPATLGNVFLASESASLPCTISAGDAIQWTLTDFFGNTLGSDTVSPAPGSQKVTLALNPGRPGYFEVSVTELRGGAAVSQASTSFAVLTPFTPSGVTFGVQTHFAQHDSPAILPLLALAGLTQIRDEQYWASIEKQAGQFAFPSTFTDYMAAATTNGLAPLVTLDWSNPLYTGDIDAYNAPSTDAQRLAYAAYATQLLSFYGGQLNTLEVWNEYNGGTFVTGPVTSDKPLYYTRMLQATYQAVKQVRPDVQIVAGATVPVAHGFFSSLFQNGAIPCLDAVSVHPYRGYPEGVDIDIRGLRELIKSYNGGREKPIWVTEYGMNARTVDDRREAAIYLAQMTTLLLTERVERVYYYLALSNSTSPYRGLLGPANDARGKYTVNPAYVVYANLIRQLTGATPQGRVAGVSASTYVCKFLQGSTPLHVLWSVLPVTVNLKTAGSLIVTDAVGASRTVSPNNGIVALSLTREVQYVRGTITGIAEAGNSLLADSLSGYSETQGQNGWSYGYTSLGANAAYSPAQFVPMRWDIWQGDNYRWIGGDTYNFVDVAGMHPSGAWAIRRWTSNYAGHAAINGTYSRGTGGDGTNLRIFVDGAEVFSAHVAPGDSKEFVASDVTLAVGSKVDFTVNQGAENSYDATALSVFISKPPGDTPGSTTTADPTTPSASSGSVGTTGTSASPSGSGAGGGGGGAPSSWFCLALLLISLVRMSTISRRQGAR
jgi:hypothetical protein